VDEGQGSQCPRLDTEHCAHPFRRSEAEPPAGADPHVGGPEIHHAVLIEGEQEQPVLLVSQEQVLGESAGHCTTAFLALAHGAVSWVWNCGRGNAKLAEPAQGALASAGIAAFRFYRCAAHRNSFRTGQDPSKKVISSAADLPGIAGAANLPHPAAVAG